MADDQDREWDWKEREVSAREREVAAREREVVTKETELKRSRWLNPVVFGLFAAALGVASNSFVSWYNSRTSLRMQKIQSEANITLEAIKTGDPQKACTNLVFLVKIGLVTSQVDAINKECKDNTAPGPPSLPVAPSRSAQPTRGEVAPEPTKESLPVLTDLVKGLAARVRLTEDETARNVEQQQNSVIQEQKDKLIAKGMSEQQAQSATFGTVGITREIGHLTENVRRQSSEQFHGEIQHLLEELDNSSIGKTKPYVDARTDLTFSCFGHSPGMAYCSGSLEKLAKTVEQLEKADKSQ